MNYWLVKSEPVKYAWDRFVADGKTHWDGVRNYQARNNLKAMKKGDKVFFYHSNEGLEIVGIAEVTKSFYQDPTTDDPNWVVVDLKPLKKLKKPVTLKQIKADDVLSSMQLVTSFRLSVSAVTPDQFDRILLLSGK